MALLIRVSPARTGSFPPLLDVKPSVPLTYNKVSDGGTLPMPTAPVNFVPDTVATTLLFIATVMLLLAPPSVNVIPVPAVRALSFGRELVVDTTMYDAARSAAREFNEAVAVVKRLGSMASVNEPFAPESTAKRPCEPDTERTRSFDNDAVAFKTK